MKLTKGIAIGALSLALGAASAQAKTLNCMVAENHDLLCRDQGGVCHGDGPDGAIVIPAGFNLLGTAGTCACSCGKTVSFVLHCNDPATGTVTLTPFAGRSIYSAGGSWSAENEACLPRTHGLYYLGPNDADAQEVTVVLETAGPSVVNAHSCQAPGK